ncbi:cell wall-binding repeat-containing protein [Herbiconiux sp. UC225_62]|uniref:cell wall-binding repeat-containing protein n=1 Tax=Herbiconiux sp. UC225_62 TaxID=3350168 RepID=UPI0036D2C207
MHESFLTAPRPLVAVRRLLLAAVATFAVTGSALAASQPAFAAAPIAADDHYSVIADTPLEPPAPGVFANDTGATSVSMTIKVVAGPSHGTVTVTGPGLFRYVPAAGFAGTDAFSYCIVKRAASPACISLDAEVSIDVTKVKAVDDAYSTPVNTPLTVPGPGVLANDTDVLPSMSVAFDPPAHGGLTPGARGGFAYTPPAGFRGADTFTYCLAADDECLSNPATVTIRVGLDGLLAVDDHYDVDVDALLVRSGADGLFSNDVGAIPGDGITIVTEPHEGSLTAVGVGGGFAYTPSDAFVGQDTFQYCITAVPLHSPCLSNVATVVVDVHPVALRVGGADRYAVSAAISARTFHAGVPVAYIASGAVFADALSGSAAAGAQRGPVLLTTRDAVPDVILGELRRLKPAKIVVLGGVASVSPAVEDVLRPLAGTVVRYDGADRYAVSARVSREAFRTSPSVAYVASGETFPDALSGSAAAGRFGGPVLLVTRDTVPAAVSTELARLKPGRIVVLGGPNTVSAGVFDALSAVASTTRIGGSDRFEVSAAVSKSTFPAGARTVYVASGSVFPDALSGSSAAIAQSAPVLLVTATALPSAVAAELDRLKPARIIVLGGTNTVSDAVLAELRGHLDG